MKRYFIKVEDEEEKELVETFIKTTLQEIVEDLKGLLAKGSMDEVIAKWQGKGIIIERPAVEEGKALIWVHTILNGHMRKLPIVIE